MIFNEHNIPEEIGHLPGGSLNSLDFQETIDRWATFWWPLLEITAEWVLSQNIRFSVTNKAAFMCLAQEMGCPYLRTWAPLWTVHPLTHWCT